MQCIIVKIMGNLIVTKALPSKKPVIRQERDKCTFNGVMGKKKEMTVCSKWQYQLFRTERIQCIYCCGLKFFSILALGPTKSR